MGADMLCGMAPLRPTVDQHRVLSRRRNSPASAVPHTGAGVCICWSGDSFQSHEQTASWNNDRNMGQRPGRAVGRDDRRAA